MGLRIWMNFVIHAQKIMATAEAFMIDNMCPKRLYFYGTYFIRIPS